MINASTPTVFEFQPVIPYQKKVLKDIRRVFDYSLGTHEILLSGSVGSSKSILGAHIALTHCLLYSGARFLLGRRAMPDLKSTIFTKVQEHIGLDLVEGRDYAINHVQAAIKFRNGSEILARSWADKKPQKVRSLELSGAFIEELTENDDIAFYNEIKMRVGRLPHIKENIIVSATNPGAPDHWAYKYFITSKSNTRHVYYSVTTDNPFLPPQYIEQLKTDLDPKLARRMIYGEWIEIEGDVIYYGYDKSINYREKFYKPVETIPIWLTFDFNIANNKPMSAALMQKVDGVWHIFKECVIKSARTADIIEELDGNGSLSKVATYYISGDASGFHRDTRSTKSDFDIIKQELANRGYKFEMRVPASNPPIRTRHNKVNSYFKNEANQVRLYVYKDAPTVDEAFRLTKLKGGAQYIEDDSKHFQHIGTAVGYAIVMAEKIEAHNSTRSYRL